MSELGYAELMGAAIVPAMLVACWSDVRRHRVPNWLNGTIAATGLAAQGIYFGWAGVQAGLMGLGTGLGLLIVLWLMHGMGAGDVKFMAALGAWLGPTATFWAVIAGGLAGGVLALGLIVYRRCWFQAATNLGVLLAKVGTVKTAFGEFGSAKSLSRSTGVLPYAVPLSIGTAFVLVSTYSGWWEVL